MYYMPMPERTPEVALVEMLNKLEAISPESGVVFMLMLNLKQTMRKTFVGT